MNKCLYRHFYMKERKGKEKQRSNRINMKSYDLQNTPRQSAITEAFAKAKHVFFFICLGNVFAEVIAFKQNIFISVSGFRVRYFLLLI